MSVAPGDAGDPGGRPSSLDLAAGLATAFDLGPVTEISRAAAGSNSEVCLFSTSGGRFCAKGRDPDRRPVASIERERRIVEYLVAQGFPTPPMLALKSGGAAHWWHGRLWSVYLEATGTDRYGAASVFAPFETAAEVRSAGAMLARFHEAMADFPERLAAPGTGLSARYELALATDLRHALTDRIADRPALEAFLGRHVDWERAVSSFERLRQPLRAAASQGLVAGVVHGDWIKRNLFFAGTDVASAIDFDLAQDGLLVHDLALAITAAAYPWDRLADGVQLGHAAAMRQGYESIRPLTGSEARLLPAVLATCRFEFHLSLIEDLLLRGQADRAAWVLAGQAAYLDWWEHRR